MKTMYIQITHGKTTEIKTLLNVLDAQEQKQRTDQDVGSHCFRSRSSIFEQRVEPGPAGSGLPLSLLSLGMEGAPAALLHLEPQPNAFLSLLRPGSGRRAGEGAPGAQARQHHLQSSQHAQTTRVMHFQSRA